MPVLAHVIMHVALCPAIARLPEQTPVTLRVKLAYARGTFEVDETKKLPRGAGPSIVDEFDAAGGTYRLTVEAPASKCAASDYVSLIAGRGRTLAETLDSGPVEPPPHVTLLSGTAPPAFGYVRPTFVVLPHAAACGAPVPEAIDAHVSVAQEYGAYYVRLPFAPALAAAPVPAPQAGASAAASASPRPAGTGFMEASTYVVPPDSDVVAMRLRSATGLYHYVRVPFEFPMPWRGWPQTITFNVIDDDVTGLATETPDVLLCPRVLVTTAS